MKGRKILKNRRWEDGVRSPSLNDDAVSSMFRSGLIENEYVDLVSYDVRYIVLSQYGRVILNMLPKLFEEKEGDNDTSSE